MKKTPANVEKKNLGNVVIAEAGLLPDEIMWDVLKDYPQELVAGLRKRLAAECPKLREKINRNSRYLGYSNGGSDAIYVYVRKKDLLIDIRLSADLADGLRRAGFEVRPRDNFQAKRGWLTGLIVPHDTDKAGDVAKLAIEALSSQYPARPVGRLIATREDLDQDTMTTQSENDAEQWPFPDPRVAGVREHYQRVKFFHALAEGCPDLPDKFRLLLAGVYSARAVIELMLEAADKGMLNSTREELKARLCSQIPWYDLIERIRIHDFHRFGLVPPDPRFKVMMQRGPVKLRAKKGAAVYRIPPTGPESITTGNSRIEEQRPLLTSDGQFFDDATSEYVSLDRILRDFVAGAAGSIQEFEENLGPTSSPT